MNDMFGWSTPPVAPKKVAYNMYKSSGNDDYMTPKSAWEAIAHLIPKDKVIWEAFYGNGDSGRFLRELGFQVLHEAKLDFFKSNVGDIIVSNPPFSKTREILARLDETEKPFILIMPAQKLSSTTMRQLFGYKRIQIIVPRKRIQFIEWVDRKTLVRRNKCSFDCLYYCYKINLPKDIIFLE